MRFFRKHTIASVATDPTTPIDRLLASLPTGPADLAVLAGAGISLDSPSNLLSGWNFMDAVLSRVMPNEVDRETRRSLISVPRDRQFRPGEYIRFETLMMELESSIDPGLHVLDCLDECAHPNVSHYVLAELLRRGAIVMTTNFDHLIEIAFERTVKPGEPALRVVHDNARFETTDSTDAQTPTLWKLHGSLTVDGNATRESVQATPVQVMSPGLSGNKRGLLRGVLASKDLLVGDTACPLATRTREGDKSRRIRPEGQSAADHDGDRPGCGARVAHARRVDLALTARSAPAGRPPEGFRLARRRRCSCLTWAWSGRRSGESPSPDLEGAVAERGGEVHDPGVAVVEEHRQRRPGGGAARQGLGDPVPRPGGFVRPLGSGEAPLLDGGPQRAGGGDEAVGAVG